MHWFAWFDAAGSIKRKTPAVWKNKKTKTKSTKGKLEFITSIL